MFTKDCEIINEFYIKQKLSVRSMVSYDKEFNRFLKFLQENHKKEMSLLDINETDAREFKVHLENTKYRKRGKEEIFIKYNGKTITKILRILLSFYEFCVKEKYLEVNPFYSVEIPMVEVGQIDDTKIHTEMENQKLLIAARENNRNYAMVLLFEESHFSVQEMLNFKWDDIYNDGMGNWVVSVITRGGKKPREIPITDEAFNTLMKYKEELIRIGKSLDKDLIVEAGGKVFLNYKYEPIKEIGIRTIISDLCTKAGIRVITPKQLLHLHVVLDLVNGVSDSQMLEQTGISSASYLKNRYKMAKRKYLQQPACKSIKLPPH